MAYLGVGPTNKGTGLFSQDTFTGDGSTVAFDMTNEAPDGGGNEIQVFVNNVRQQEGSSNAYTLGFDGSSVFKRITFTAAPEAAASIYVLNPGTSNVQQISTVGDNAVTTAKVQNLAISTAKIAADAINATKIADDAISEEHLDNTVITGLAELSEEANNSDVLIVFDASTNTLKKILRSNLVLQAPTVTSVTPTSVLSGDGTGNHTFIINGTGFTGASASLLNNSGSTISFDTVTVNSSIKITGVIAKASLLDSGEPFDVKVTAASGLAATLENQINVNASPTFNTASGSLGTVLNGVRSVSLFAEAFDPESAGNCTFELQSGSLPAGATLAVLNENGVSKAKISGFNAVGSNTTSNFVLRAVDAASNTTSRAFSITVNAPASQSFTTSGTFSVPTGLTAVDVLVVAGGGGTGRRGGGGGSGGLIFMPAAPVTPGGTVTVTVGEGGGPATAQSGSNMRGITGQDSAFGTLVAKGGGGGGAAITGGALDGTESPNLRAGLPGGSGGGHARDGSVPRTGPASTATQPTQSGNSGAYGFGNAGGTSYDDSQSGAGGGGGAGAAGGQGRSTSCGPAAPGPVSPTHEWGGAGGVGKAYTIGDGTTSVYYAGGGGGTANTPAPVENQNIGYGGQGGGGNGGKFTSDVKGQSGAANTGGGGGGGAESESPVGTSGGKGIVIVRF